MVCYFLRNWDLTWKVVIIVMPVFLTCTALTVYKVLLVSVIPSYLTPLQWTGDMAGIEELY